MVMASVGVACPAVFGADDRPRLAKVPDSPETGKALAPWREGELDLHFVYTGRGENMFYRFPDGTTMVNDTGDFYRPKEVKNIPWHPSRDLLGGERIAPTVAEVADGWQWYEFAPMKLKDSFSFDFKPGRFAKGGGRTAVDAVYFDRMEIRAE